VKERKMERKPHEENEKGEREDGGGRWVRECKEIEMKKEWRVP